MIDKRCMTALKPLQNSVSAIFDGLTTVFATISYCQSIFASTMLCFYREVDANNSQLTSVFLGLGVFMFLHEGLARFAIYSHNDYNESSLASSNPNSFSCKIFTKREKYFATISAIAGTFDFSAFPSAILGFTFSYISLTETQRIYAGYFQTAFIIACTVSALYCAKATFMMALKHIYGKTNQNLSKAMGNISSSRAQNILKAFTEGCVSVLTISSYIVTVAEDVFFLTGNSESFNPYIFLVVGLSLGVILGAADAISHHNQYHNANHWHDGNIQEEQGLLQTDQFIIQTQTSNATAKLLSYCCTIACCADIAGLPSVFISTLGSYYSISTDATYHSVRLGTTAVSTGLALFASTSLFSVADNNNSPRKACACHA